MPTNSEEEKAVSLAFFLAIFLLAIGFYLFIGKHGIFSLIEEHEYFPVKENPIVQAAYKKSFKDNIELQKKIDNIEERLNLLEKRLESNK